MSEPNDSTEPPTSVGIVVTSNLRRGAEVQAERTASGLSGLGWDVEFRSLSHSPEPVVGATPLSDLDRAALGRFSWTVVSPTRRLLERHVSGVVLAWGSLSVRHVAVAAIGLRRRPRLGAVGIGSPSAWLSSTAAIGRYRMLARRYDFMMAVSQQIATELTELVGVPAAKVNVITSGVPDELFSLRRRQHDGPPRVLFVGSLSAEKDPEAAIASVTTALSQTDLTLRVVGDGPLRKATERAAMESDAAERIEFAGSVADMTPHYAWADIVLLTSKTEGLPGVLLEAAAAGLPAVAYDVGAVEEIIDDRVSGIIVRGRAPDEAAQGLVTLATDEGLRRRLGEGARDIARRRFTMKQMVHNTDALLTAQLV